MSATTTSTSSFGSPDGVNINSQEYESATRDLMSHLDEATKKVFDKYKKREETLEGYKNALVKVMEAKKGDLEVAASFRKSMKLFAAVLQTGEDTKEVGLTKMYDFLNTERSARSFKIVGAEDVFVPYQSPLIADEETDKFIEALIRGEDHLTSLYEGDWNEFVIQLGNIYTHLDYVGAPDLVKECLSYLQEIVKTDSNKIFELLELAKVDTAVREVCLGLIYNNPHIFAENRNDERMREFLADYPMRLGESDKSPLSFSVNAMKLGLKLDPSIENALENYEGNPNDIQSELLAFAKEDGRAVMSYLKKKTSEYFFIEAEQDKIFQNAYLSPTGIGNDLPDRFNREKYWPQILQINPEFIRNIPQEKMTKELTLTAARAPLTQSNKLVEGVLSYANNDWKSNQELILAAVKQDKNNIPNIDLDLLNSKGFMEELCAIGTLDLTDFPIEIEEKYKNDADIMLLLLPPKSSKAEHRIGEDLMKNRDFINKAAKIFPSIVGRVPLSLLDRDSLLIGLKNKLISINSINVSFYKDEPGFVEFINAAVKDNPQLIRKVHTSLLDRDFLLICVENKFIQLKNLDAQYQQDPDFIKVSDPEFESEYYDSDDEYVSDDESEDFDDYPQTRFEEQKNSLAKDPNYFSELDHELIGNLDFQRAVIRENPQLISTFMLHQASS